MTTEEKNEAPASLENVANGAQNDIETPKSNITTTVEQKSDGNITPKPSHLRQRWKRKPSASAVATIREDTTPQPKELKAVEIPTAERLNYSKETFHGENRDRRPRERDERHGNGERFGCRERREGFDKNNAHHEKPCGCHEGQEDASCMCHSLLKKAKRFFGKLFGSDSKPSEATSCGCDRHGEQKRFDRGANRPGGYHRHRRHPGNRPPRNRGE